MLKFFSLNSSMTHLEDHLLEIMDGFGNISFWDSIINYEVLITRTITGLSREEKYA